MAVQRFDWATFLREYNAELLASGLLAGAVRHRDDADLAAAMATGWLGYPGATEQQVARAEARRRLADGRHARRDRRRA